MKTIDTMKITRLIPAVFLAATALLGGCANTSQPESSSSRTGVSYGVIDAMETSQESGGGIAGSGIGVGTVVGGVVGGVLGSQVGGGSGQDIATVVGVVGGAVAGHEIDKRRQQSTYKLRVRLDNGTHETVTQQDVGGMRVGDRVRVENHRVSPY